jgi:hypothetical protein
MRESARAALFSAILVVFGVGAGTFVSEAGYRLYLAVYRPDLFSGVWTSGGFTVFARSMWEFDERFGYVYAPERKIDLAGIDHSASMPGGRVVSCGNVGLINRLGNSGDIVGDYASASLKIAVFGDSWTAYNIGGRTWPLALQEILERRLGRSVHVLNFGRDGYGILQMFDLAAAKLPEWRPDLAVVAFITDDFDRARFWRTATLVDGDERVLTTTLPLRDPPLENAADTQMIDSRVTRDWCERARASGVSDDVTRALVAKHKRLLDHARLDGFRTPSVWTLRHSYLMNLVAHGDPVHFAWRRLTPSQNPRIDFADYARDSRFLESLAQVKASGVRLELMHLAIYPEISTGIEYPRGGPHETLLASLERLTGQRVHRTIDHVEMPVASPERMNHSADNFHPSVWGMEFYAQAVADMLLRGPLAGRAGSN